MSPDRTQALLEEVNSIKRQISSHSPISEPTIRHTLLRILTIVDYILEEK